MERKAKQMETNEHKIIFDHAIDLKKIAVSGPGFCSLIMATCPEPEPKNPNEEVCGHCPLAKMAKEYREKAEKIDREGRGVHY